MDSKELVKDLREQGAKWKDHFSDYDPTWFCLAADKIEQLESQKTQVVDDILELIEHSQELCLDDEADRVELKIRILATVKEINNESNNHN